jgi:small subunit ribosomal protein S15
MVTKEKKVDIVKGYGKSDKDTGAPEVQIALLTEHIIDITRHLEGQKKDYSSARGLMKMVGQRKRLLHHLQRTNLESYRKIIEKLDLRK